MNHLGIFRHGEQSLKRGAKVVIRTERGVELGEVLIEVAPKSQQDCDDCSTCRTRITSDQLGSYLSQCGPEYPCHRGGKVLRLANAQDTNDQRHLDSQAHEELSYCRQQMRELNLPMKLVTVEHPLGGERIIFYFSSETRVDFRELVRRLAAQYRTRIEMRQVGSRDEARLVADYERCGQRCCCQQYIKDLRPVSMRMAKTQKATLDPSKISGRCGRLMCCLRYEDEGYETLRKKLPRKNVWVKTAAVVGKVIDTHILTQLVRLWLVDNTQVVVANEEILERNVEPPPIPVMPQRRERPQRDRSEMRLLRDEGEAKPAPPPAQPPPQLQAPALEEPLVDPEEADLPDEADDQAPAQTPGAQAPTQARSPDAQSGDPAQRRKRRRRRRKRGRGGAPQGQPGVPAPPPAQP
jgi:cell fate regulator YaaT (PSP1 superfamily)